MAPARMPARTFQDLVAWQKAHELALAVYRVTSGFPKAEVFGLTAQMRSASVSVAANIAEGFKRTGRSDKARMLNIAQGSLEELRYYLVLATDLKYADCGPLSLLLEDASRLLEVYRRRILDSVP